MRQVDELLISLADCAARSDGGVSVREPRSRRWAFALAAAGLVALGGVIYVWQPASAAATRYEAETATIVQGVVESTHVGFSGTGYANYNNVVGSYVQWTVDGGSG